MLKMHGVRYDPGIACLCQPTKATCSGADAATKETVSAWNCNPEPPCAALLPYNGNLCLNDGLRCEYLRDFCADPTPSWTVAVARCDSGSWSVTGP